MTGRHHTGPDYNRSLTGRATIAAAELAAAMALPRPPMPSPNGVLSNAPDLYTLTPHDWAAFLAGSHVYFFVPAHHPILPGGYHSGKGGIFSANNPLLSVVPASWVEPITSEMYWNEGARSDYQALNVAVRNRYNNANNGVMGINSPLEALAAIALVGAAVYGGGLLAGGATSAGTGAVTGASASIGAGTGTVSGADAGTASLSDLAASSGSGFGTVSADQAAANLAGQISAGTLTATDVATTSSAALDLTATASQLSLGALANYAGQYGTKIGQTVVQSATATEAMKMLRPAAPAIAGYTGFAPTGSSVIPAHHTSILTLALVAGIIAAKLL